MKNLYLLTTGNKIPGTSANTLRIYIISRCLISQDSGKKEGAIKLHIMVDNGENLRKCRGPAYLPGRAKSIDHLKITFSVF